MKRCSPPPPARARLPVPLAFALALGAGCAGATIARRPGQALSAAWREIARKDARSAPYCPDAVEGEVCLMTWSQARAYCAAEGAHLPTAREFAPIVIPRGTRILERSAVAGSPPAGFYLVDCLNPDGARDAFYMNHADYRAPKERGPTHLLWTASVPPEHPEYAHVYYDAWGGGGGEPADHRLTHPNAVQCVDGP